MTEKLSQNETVYIALGSNLGDRYHYLSEARHRINQLPKTQILRSSDIYETEPANNEPQPMYLNQVVAVKTALEPVALLDHLLSIEAQLGRVRDPENQNASRTIDLDIILFGDRIINHPRLQVPHPRMHQRDFVLKPLADVQPQPKPVSI